MEGASAAEYDDVATNAVLSVLLEIGQVLGAFKERFVVIGGSVPWLLLPQSDPPHLGTLDIDLSLDAEALGDGDYKTLVEALVDAGYERNQDQMKWFQLRRVVEVADHGPVAVLVDLLMPREAKFKRNKPPLLADFAVQKADGAAVAMKSFVPHTLDGTMPDGRRNAVDLRVASIPALLVMKGYALVGRNKQKDAYDIYFCVRGYNAGIEALAAECASLLDDTVALNGFRHIASKFRSEDDFGPTTVRDFLAAGEPFAGMTPEQLRLDAYQQVRALLDRLRL